MKQSFYEMDCARILELQGMIEDRTGKMFHELDPELDALCVKALDGETHASYVINQLAKLFDNLNQ